MFVKSFPHLPTCLRFLFDVCTECSLLPPFLTCTLPCSFLMVMLIWLVHPTCVLWHSKQVPCLSIRKGIQTLRLETTEKVLLCVYTCLLLLGLQNVSLPTHACCGLEWCYVFFFFNSQAGLPFPWHPNHPFLSSCLEWYCRAFRWIAVMLSKEHSQHGHICSCVSLSSGLCSSAVYTPSSVCCQPRFATLE